MPIEKDGRVFLVSSGEGLYDPAPGTFVVSLNAGNLCLELNNSDSS